MKIFKVFKVVFWLLLLGSCEKELDLAFPVTPSKLVVEGWIENGQQAEVILSHSAPYFSEIDSGNLMQFGETHAKVTIFSDSNREILTLKPNQGYFPPFVYQTVHLKGESGKSYSVEIISQDDTVTATTTIPDVVTLDSVWFATDPGENNKGRLWIRLTDNGNENNFYRILYKRKGKDGKYTGTNISTFSDNMINGTTTEMGFLRGFSSLLSLEKENYFEKGDTISVKFCTIDEEQFNFWNVYQGKVIASANPLATANNQLNSNINGGLGMWSGYGAAYYVVIAR